jgi:exopolyphosphatase/pppGpp-phosphohydrolase
MQTTKPMVDLTSTLSAEQMAIWNESLDIARACEFEEEHSLQVTYLSLRIFDELAAMHFMGEKERFWLLLSGLLHDIGWIEGWKGHHKSSLNIILTTPMLSLENRDRLRIGSICRYHRRALPDIKHDHFSALDQNDQVIVTKLASFIRVADGLDRTHRNIVADLKARYDEQNIWIACQCIDSAVDEQREGLKKGNLLELTYNRKLHIQWTIK